MNHKLFGLVHIRPALGRPKPKERHKMRTHTIKHAIKGIGLATVVAAVAASSALASGGNTPPYVSHTTASTTYSDGYAAVLVRHFKHADELSTSRDAGSPGSRDGRSPDTRDAALTAQQNVTAPADGRSRDTIDAAIQAHAPVVTVIHSPGFQWSDFGIGVAAAFSAMLMLGLPIRLLAARQNRKQTSPVATA